MESLRVDSSRSQRHSTQHRSSALQLAVSSALRIGAPLGAPLVVLQSALGEELPSFRLVSRWARLVDNFAVFVQLFAALHGLGAVGGHRMEHRQLSTQWERGLVQSG